MQNDLISIIVPVFNLENELPRCLNSILAQTYQNIEVIVVDDGSSDNSADVMRFYASKDRRVKPVLQANGGVTSARLYGVKESSGQWIGFADGDDEIESNMYERLLKNAIAYHADISHCGYQMCFEDGRIHYFHNTGLLAQQDKTTALKELLSGSRIEPGLCNKLFHKNLFYSLLHEEIMPMDIKINEDLLMNYFLFSAAEQTVFEDWCPYHYIVRGASASRAKLNEHKIYDPIKVKEIILKSTPNKLQAVAQRAFVNTCVYSYCSLVQEKGYQVHQAQRDFREKLKNHYEWCQMLPKRAKLLARLIVMVPWVLHIAYPIYARFIQTKQYT